MTKNRTPLNPTASLRQRLRGQIPSDRLGEPLQDGSCGVVRPETGNELSLIINAAMEEGLLLHPPDAELPPKNNYLELDLRRLSKILDLDPNSRTVTVQGGVLTGTIEQWLRIHGWTLGWFTPGLEELPLAELIQDARAYQPSPRYGGPVDSVLGFHAVLPDGREMWNKEAPGRATGPDLLSVLSGGFSFGVLTRLVLSIHERPLFEDETIIEGPSLSALLTLGGRIARLADSPARVLITRKDSERKRRAKPQWVLRAFWHLRDSEALSPEINKGTLKGFKVTQKRHEGISKSDAWGPGLGRARTTLQGQLSESLIDALNRSPGSWILSFENSHKVHIWADLVRKPGPKDRVREWMAQQFKNEEPFLKFTESMLSEALAFRHLNSD